MEEIINSFYGKALAWGELRVRTGQLLRSQELSVEEVSVVGQVAQVLALELVRATTGKLHINDYCPGRNVLDTFSGIPMFANPLLRAMFHDVLQQNKVDKFRNVGAAVTAYMEVASARDSTSERRDFYLRTIDILKGLGKGNRSLLPLFLPVLLEDIGVADMMVHCYSVARLAGELTGLQLGDEVYSKLAEQLIGAIGPLSAKGEFGHCRECYRALTQLVPQQARNYAELMAYSYVVEGDALATIENISQHRVASQYKKAVQLYRQLEVTDQRMQEAMDKLEDAQQKAAVQLGHFGVPIGPVSDDKVLEIPVFEDFLQALYWLIGIPLPSKKDIVERNQRDNQHFISRMMMGSVISDRHGNTVGTSADNTALVYRNAVIYKQLVFQKILHPTYIAFSDQFSLSEREVYDLISENGFVPDDRRSVYAHGLYHGFKGDFLVAVHLLLPQLEHGLRMLLRRYGGTTRKVANEVQTENGLGGNLKSLEGILYEDLLFDLEGLLNEAFGWNLRNEVAHGLCELPMFYGAPGFYVWWISLKLAMDLDSLLLGKPTDLR